MQQSAVKIFSTHELNVILSKLIKTKLLTILFLYSMTIFRLPI